MTFLDPCLNVDYVEWGTETQANPAPHNYDGDVTFVYTPISVTPDWCTVTPSCVSITDSNDVVSTYLTCDNLGTLTNNQIVKSITGDDYQAGLAPGVYNVNMKV